MHIGPARRASAVVLAMMTTLGCSSSNGGGTGGSGGGSSTGGTPGTGGVPATGGAGGRAGSPGTGGGGNGGSGTSPVTTISGTKALNALSTTEATQLCNDTYAYFGSAISMTTICKWQGLFYGSQSSPPSQSVLQQKCTQKETSCTGGGDPWANNIGCNDLPSDCSATVAQYATCIHDQVAAFVQTVNGLPDCASLMTTDESKVTDAQINANPPASCASLVSQCADLTPPSPYNQ
jgi:hypothetical protein